MLLLLWPKLVAEMLLERRSSLFMNNFNLNNLKSINYLFNHNKSNLESLIKEAEQITGCNLRNRCQSERTYFAYERTYLEPEEIEQARKNKELPGQENNTIIKKTKSKKFTTYYTEVKTNRPGYIDAHIENTYESGEKYYHLMTADKDQAFFHTKFYDKPIATLCFTETEILYIPADDWIKQDRKSYESLLRTMGDKAAQKWGPFNESTYTAVNRNLRFDTNGIAINPFKSVYLNILSESQNQSKFYIGRPSFRGYTGVCASYKNGETANKTLLCISPLMGEEALSENSYAKCAGICQSTVNKSILAKGYYYNKNRGDIAIDGKFNDIINQMTQTICHVKELNLKSDIYPILVDFIISEHVDFIKNTVGIRTARKECDLLEALEDYLK